MLPWENRPNEVANLFNPAFCALLLTDSIAGFQEYVESGMPYPLSFLILPLTLHKSTRELLPKSLRTKLHVWLQSRPEVRIGFAKRSCELVPYTKEGLVFGLQANSIEITQEGTLAACKGLGKISSWVDEAESAICREKSRFLGRWLAHSGDVSTIFVMWGIRP